MLKEEKGITLVALIITIIVLIILAAVTIMSFTQTGIINTAVNGTINYANAQRHELVTMNDLDTNLQQIIQKVNEAQYGKTDTSDTKTEGEEGTGE